MNRLVWVIDMVFAVKKSFNFEETDVQTSKIAKVNVV
jgi:hypothetical protein